MLVDQKRRFNFLAPPLAATRCQTELRRPCPVLELCGTSLVSQRPTRTGKSPMKHIVLAVLLTMTLGFATTAEPSPLTWYLQDVRFTDAIATGSYVFDMTVGRFGTYSSADIDVIENSSGTTFHYSGNGNTGSFHEVCFCANAPTRFLMFDFSPLPATGGIVSLDSAFSLEALPPRSRRIFSGSLTTTPVSEPSSLSALWTGVGALPFVRRRRTR